MRAASFRLAIAKPALSAPYSSFHVHSLRLRCLGSSLTTTARVLRSSRSCDSSSRRASVLVGILGMSQSDGPHKRLLASTRWHQRGVIGKALWSGIAAAAAATAAVAARHAASALWRLATKEEPPTRR